MAKVMICVATMDKVDASFFASVLGLRYDWKNHRYAWNVKSNSLIYDARNQFALEAVNGDYQYAVMLDSDMVLAADTLTRLVNDIDETGAALVTGLYFKRRLPTAPLILKSLEWHQDSKYGPQEFVDGYEDYSKDDVFEIAGCGMGCAILRVDVLNEMFPAFQMGPFTPLPRLSEDYSFCWRLAQMDGGKMLCDSRIKPKHAGIKLYGEADWDRQREADNA